MTSADISETVVHVDTMVYNPDLPTRVDIGEIMVHGSHMTVKSVETAAMAAPTMPPSERGVWRAEHGNAQQRSCDASGSPFCPWPGAIFVQPLH